MFVFSSEKNITIYLKNNILITISLFMAGVNFTDIKLSAFFLAVNSIPTLDISMQISTKYRFKINIFKLFRLFLTRLLREDKK